MKALVKTLIFIPFILLACGQQLESDEPQQQESDVEITSGVYDVLVNVTSDTCWGETGLRIAEWELRFFEDETGKYYELSFGSETTLRSTMDEYSIQFTQELHDAYTKDGEDCEATMVVLIDITPTDDPNVFTGKGEMVITSTCEGSCSLSNSLSGRLQNSIVPPTE